LRELGLNQQLDASEMIECSLAQLFDHGWLVGDEWLSITDAGRERLRQQVRRTRREAHRLRRAA
jgi:hypothetical protein